MNKYIRNWLVIASIITIGPIILAACTAVTSLPLDDSKGNHGVPYSVPLALLPINITIDEANETITFASAQPNYKPDLNFSYRVFSPYSVFHEEKTTLGVADQLINTAKVISDSKLTEIISTAAALTAEGSFTTAKASAVFSRQIEVGSLSSSPEDLHALNRSIQSSIVGYVRHTNSHGKRSFLSGHINRQVVDVDVEKLYRTNVAAASKSAENCQIGVCYRVKIPYRISVRFFNGTQHEEIVYLPNDSPIFALAIKRGVFSDWTTDATFVNGMPTVLQRDTTSELEAIVSLPANIIAAQIATLTQAISLIGKQSSLIEAERDLAELRTAENALRNTLLFSFNNGVSTNSSQQSTPPTPEVLGGGANPGPQTTPSNDGTGG